MGKRSRRRNKRTRRYVTEEPTIWRGPRPPSTDGPLCDVRVDLRTGKVTTVTIPPGLVDLYAHYIEQHRLLPIDVDAWSADELDTEVQALLRRGSPRDWEQALMILAHHRSERAVELLVGLQHQVPADLEPFWQLAHGEALGWLGYDVIADGSQPRILPAGAPADTAPN